MFGQLGLVVVVAYYDSAEATPVGIQLAMTVPLIGFVLMVAVDKVRRSDTGNPTHKGEGAIAGPFSYSCFRRASVRLITELTILFLVRLARVFWFVSEFSCSQFLRRLVLYSPGGWTVF